MVLQERNVGGIRLVVVVEMERNRNYMWIM